MQLNSSPAISPNYRAAAAAPDAKIVAIDTSGRHGSVALARGPTLLAQAALSENSRHAVELMPTLDQLVRSQNWSPSQIDHLYLSLGPGSFTGLRIAVALARALHQAAGCKLIGIPTLDVLAQNAPPEFTTVVPILDAKRAQVFAARYTRDPAGQLHRKSEPALVDPRAFLAQAIELDPAHRVAILGEGVDYHRTALTQPGAVELDKSLWPGRAATVHHLGYQLARQNAFANPATLLPLYIRLPEAEEVYRKKHNLPLT